MTDVVRPLTGLLAVQLGLAAWTWWPAPTSTDATRPLIDGGADALSALSIRGGADDVPVALARVGDAWTVASAHGYPAKATQMDKVLTALGEATLGRPVTENATSHAKLGVDDASAQRILTLTTADGTETTAFLGAAGRDSVHLRLQGDDAVYAVSGFGVFTFRDDTRGYLPTYAVEAAADTLGRLELQRGDDLLAFVRDGEGWGVDGDPTRVATEAFTAVLDKATRIRIDEVLAASPTPEHGLAGDGTVRVSWGLSPDTTDGSYVVGAEVGDHVAVQVDGTPHVIGVRRAGLAPLLDTPWDALTQPRPEATPPSEPP